MRNTDARRRCASPSTAAATRTSRPAFPCSTTCSTLLAAYASFDLALEVAPGDAEDEVRAAGRAFGEALAEPLRAEGRPRPRLGCRSVRRGARARRARGERRAAARLARRPHRRAARRHGDRLVAAFLRELVDRRVAHAARPPDRRLRPASRARGDLQGARHRRSRRPVRPRRERKSRMPETHRHPHGGSPSPVPGGAVLAGDPERRLRLRLGPARAEARRHGDLGGRSRSRPSRSSRTCRRSSRRRAAASTGS